jgi:hypothetical protein
MLDHVRKNGRVRYRWSAHADLTTVIDHENTVKSDFLAGFDGKALDFERITRAYTILFASGF